MYQLACILVLVLLCEWSGIHRLLTFAACLGLALVMPSPSEAAQVAGFCMPAGSRYGVPMLWTLP